MSLTTYRVLLADDHALVRHGLKRILAAAGDLLIAGGAASGEETLALVASTPADVLLLDLAMPGLSGIDLIRRIGQSSARLPILVLSMHNEAQIVTRALRAGAAGYITKGADPEDLVVAVRKVAAGGRFIDASLVDSVVFRSAADEDSPHALLSPRELQVLERVAAGMALGDIADELHLSPKTVSTHKMRLMQKLEVSTNADLLKYAVRHGLTTS